MDYWLAKLQSLGYEGPLFNSSYFSSFHKTIIDQDFLVVCKNQPTIFLIDSCNDRVILLLFFKMTPMSGFNMPF